MGLFTIAKTADSPQAPAHAALKTSTTIFRCRASKAVEAIAAATLEAGGFDPAIAEPESPGMGLNINHGTKYAGISPDTGKPMYAMPEDAPQPMEWKEAKNYAKDLTAHDHQDW